MAGHSHQGERLTVSAGSPPLAVLSTGPSGELSFAHWTTKLKYHGRNPDMQQCQNMYHTILKGFKITVFTQGYYRQNKWKFYGLRKETQF